MISKVIQFIKSCFILPVFVSLTIFVLGNTPILLNLISLITFILNKRFISSALFLITLLLLLNSQAFSQLSDGGVPPSTTFSLPENRDIVHLTSPDLQPIQREDNDFPTPYRYGINLPADFSPENSGDWLDLSDGGRLWRLTVQGEGALALSACFDRFHLPAGAKLFLYNMDKSKVIGAFTQKNNTPQGYFATELLSGDQVTFEYYEPKGTTANPDLHISEIVYAYRGVEFLGNLKGVTGTSGPCEVNVNCPEGENWQLQKKGVVRISVNHGGASSWCTGSLINNVRQDHTPYILTADHCGINATPEQLLQWVFYFDFEAPGCQAPETPPVPKSLTGAIRVAESGYSAYQGSDFYLVVLNGPIPSTYDVYYNGWNRLNSPSQSGVGIHHPVGDIKKISTYSKILQTSTYGSNPDLSFWKVSWDKTVSGHGVTEGGSSGSPIFDAGGRIVGTLTGGETNCDTANINKSDYYGKIFWSWNLNGSDSTRRLRDWLDPDSTGVNFLDGIRVSINEKERKGNIRIFPNPFEKEITIELPDPSTDAFRVEVYNLLGKMIKNHKVGIRDHSSGTVTLPDLNPGVYMLRVFTEDEVFCVKLIKQ